MPHCPLEGNAWELARTLGLGGASCLHPATAWDPGPAPGISLLPAGPGLSQDCPVIHAACPGWGLGPLLLAWLSLALRWTRAEMGCACNPGVPATTLPLVTEVPEPRQPLATRRTLRTLQVSFLSSVVQIPAPAPSEHSPPHRGLCTWSGVWHQAQPGQVATAFACPPQGQGASSGITPDS